MARRVRKSRAGLQRWNQMTACLRDMNFAFTNVSLYPPTHKEVNAVLARLLENLQAIFVEQDDVGFGFMDEMLYVEGSMSIEETKRNEMLVERFAKCRIKYMTIMKTVRREDLLAFFAAMTDEAKRDRPRPPSEAAAEKGIENIHVVEAETDDQSSRSKQARRRTLYDWYAGAVSTLGGTLEELRKGPGADLKPLYRMADDMMATMRTKGHEPFLLLPRLARGLDPHAAHAVNVAITACALGTAAGLNSGQVQTLVVAAFLHDLGRSIIPLEWTRSAAPLSLFERAAAAQHPAWGFLLLARDPQVPLPVALLAGKHHDAGGAEDEGYRPDAFHRILALADAYDLAAFSDRFYWRKHRPDRVLRSLLRRRGRLYDPALLKLLVQLVGLYPVGTPVLLDDGRRGIVVRAEPMNAARPRVWLFDERPAAPPEGPAEDADGDREGVVLADLLELREGGLSYRASIRSALPDGALDTASLLDSKKEFLLSFAL